MPARFTPEQLAASAAAGELRTESTFAGDTATHARGPWHAYQDSFFSAITLGQTLPPVGDSNRAKQWKAARRQRGKIEEQRAKDAERKIVLAPQDGNVDVEQRLVKRLKVSDKWAASHAGGATELTASTPRGTPGGRHATRQLRATVATPGGDGTREYGAEVRYSLPPPAGESESAAKRREDRHRRREQLALERLGGAYEKEMAAQLAAEAAEARQRAEEEARLQRMEEVVRDGNTPYVHATFRPVDAATRPPFDERDVRVYYPDGASCDVAPPRAGRTRTPWRLVQPWTWRPGVLPPVVCAWATLEELKKMTVAMLSMSSAVDRGETTGWRRRHLTMAVCRDAQCPCSGDCVTYELQEVPPASALVRLGIAWATQTGPWRHRCMCRSAGPPVGMPAGMPGRPRTSPRRSWRRRSLTGSRGSERSSHLSRSTVACRPGWPTCR